MLPGQMQACPYTPAPKKFGAHAQTPLEVNSSPQLDEKGIKRVQKIVGSILYYARAVDMTVLMALSAIAVKQTKAMTKTMGKCIQLLDYLASNSEAKFEILCVRYDYEHTLGRILPVGNRSTQQSMRAFFHGMDATK